MKTFRKLSKRAAACLLLALILAAQCCIPALALDTSRSFEFALSADSSAVKAGDTLVVTLTLTRTDAEGEYAMYSIQDTVSYDKTYLELVSADTSASGFDATPRDGGVLISSYSTRLAGTKLANPLTMAVLTFTVLDKSGTAELSNTDCRMGTSNGMDVFSSSVKDISVTVAGTPKHEHSYTGAVTSPTCTEQGYTIYTCECGDTYTSDYTVALGHSYASVVTEPTVTEQGYTTYTCTRCGDSYIADYVSPTGEQHIHKYTPEVTEPTCTEQGYTTYTCECGVSYISDYTAPLGHDYKGETVTENGVAYNRMTCTRCGHSYDMPVPAQPKPELPFTDVTGHWALNAIRYAYENKLMDGVGGGRFDPEGTLNRAMLVTILYRLEGEPTVTAANPFTDVPAGMWYTSAVIWAAENKIVDGYGNGKFGPEDDITREQMAKMLFAYTQFKKYDTTKENDLAAYTDAVSISTWALEAMKWANAEGLVTGTSATTLNPGGNAKRAEAATILMRYMENVVK